MKKIINKFFFLATLALLFIFIININFPPQTCKSTISSYETDVINNYIQLTTTPYSPINAPLRSDIDTTNCFSYITATLNGYSINAYRNSQNHLIIISTDFQGNCSVISTYEDWSYYCFEEFESSLLKNNFSLCSTYDNLFGTQALALEFPVGANAILYIIIGERNGNIQLLFQNIDSGLIIDNIDNDKDLELISSLNGYFYDTVDDNIYQYNMVLSEDISQVVWDERKHKTHIYYTDRSQKNGIIDTVKMKIILEDYSN